MNNLIIALILFLAPSFCSSQTLTDGFKFCHNEAGVLSSVYNDKYALQFINGQFKFFRSKDSVIFYDADSRSLEIRQKGKLEITVHLDNHFRKVIIDDKRVSKIYEKEFIKIGERHCDSVPVMIETAYNDPVMIQYTYNYCVLTHFAVIDHRTGTFNFFLSRIPYSSDYFWDVCFNQMDKVDSLGTAGVKIISLPRTGKPSFIALYEKEGLSFREAAPGIEILQAGKKKKIFDLVQAVSPIKNSLWYKFEEVISYDKKGIMKESKIPVLFCTGK